MENLLFERFIFKDGPNTTIRRGIKPYHKKQQLLALPVKGQTAELIEVVLVRYKRFEDLTAKDVENEHDPEARTYQGLLRSMKRNYPHFTEDEIVTIIDFVRVERV